MAAEPSSSSWHPAVMPHNAATAAAATETPADATRSTSSPNGLPIQPEKSTTIERPSNGNVEPSRGEGVANASFSQDDEGGDDAWLASEEPASEHLPTEPATENSEPVAAANPKTSTSQHASSMSFARTVSHDLTFGDDDEGDWNLSRTDTDPFKFMPPSDRTNSFPVVPPMSLNSDSREQPLPSNQAADVLEENDKDVDAEEEEYQRGNAPEHSDELNAPKRQHARSISIGGDLPGPERRDSEARYEEGLPLISPQGQEQLREDSNTAAVSSFDDDTANGDDFFSQVQSSQPDSTLNGLSAKPLERKSTMQVLNSVDPSPFSRQSTLDEEEELSNQTGENVGPEGQPKEANSSKDLAAKWEAAFEDDDDDDFLLEDSTPPENKEVDPAAFFGSDDEGFLEDDEPAPPPQPPSTTAQNPYLPGKPSNQRAASYTPATTAPVQATPGGMYGAPAPATTPYGSASQYNIPAPAERPALPRAQSFVEKSKGGYSSPYDLPTDLVKPLMKPRKRASMQQLPQSSAPPPQGPPLPRSTSMFMPGPPSNSLSPPTSSHGSQGAPVHQGPPLQHKPPTPGVQHKENFFEELPMVPKPRPSSRTSIRAPSPAQHPPPMAYGAHAAPPMASATNQMLPPPLPAHAVAASQPPAPQPTGVGNLVAPERVSPYAALSTPANHLPPPSAPNGSRYSPAPGAAGSHSAPPAPANSRYSPAPPATKGHASYGPVAASAVPPPILPFQPRTSSPLTHCETNHGPNGEPSLAERRMSSYETRLTRMSSLPPTREVDEEEDQTTPIRSLSATHPPSHVESRYSPGNSPKATRRTPPPPSYAGQLTLSPPKQSGPGYIPHAPHAPPTAQAGFVPPPRAQTQSPSAAYGHKQGTRSSDHTRRPSSAHSATSPVMTRPTNVPYAPTTRVRGQSITMNLVAPTDGREKDPLQRWKGCPIFTWGVGGTIVTSFPNSVPRYGMKQSVPTIIRTPGEVKVRNVKDIEPLQERLAKFPGPLKGKSKKKETIAWLTAGIETLEKEVPDISFHSQLSLESKRTIERLILWRILRIFIEHDGVLEGTPAVEKAVRDVLSPGTITPTADDDALFPRIGGLGVEPTSVTAMSADGADVSTMDQIRHHLLRGDREKAVWALVDKRLWGHAMLISHTVSGDLYKQVAQEFVRKEVNYPGHNNESMAALYQILSGNFDDCVDELVPVHARAGLQLMSTQSGPGPAKATLDGLDKWRETLCLVLSNRSVDDIRGLNALGNLLSSYGRAEAAHICFLFGRNASHFGGLDDPTANIVLLGADHHQQADQFAKETEALQLSEVYEYGLSLAGGVAAAAGVPHLAAYKLQLAMTLAEYGYRDKALQYCDAIETAMTSQTKRSPYHHAILEAAVNDFTIRLKQAPKDETNSWISKPSMNKVSDSMWNRFNKFVAGEENDNNGAGPGGEGESGPFGRIATTPTMSRSPSVSNFEVYGGQSPGYPMGIPPPAATAAGSRYAPATVAATPSSNPYDPSSQTAAAPRSSLDRGSNEFTRNSYEPTHQASSGGYMPMGPSASESNIHQSDSGMVGAPGLAPAPQITQGTPFGGYQPFGMPTSASMPALPTSGEDKVADSSQQGYQPLSYGYEPPSLTPDAPTPEAEVVTAESGSGGYEPPSFQPYGYEPPSYQPDPEPTADDEDDAPKPKKKSFMDDDDDIPALKPKTQSKSEKDRENEEMFRKAAEEDAKRAAAGQQSPKKGWGFSGWFGGSKKPETPAAGDQSPGKPIRAKLGEASSFVYDPELKRWVNKKPGAENVPAKTATPPPPRTIPRSVSGTPPPTSTGTPPPPMASSAPSGGMPLHMRSATPELTRAPSMDNLGLSAPPLMNRSVSNPSLGGSSMPPPGSRPSTAMSNASSIDDLIGAAAPRKPGEKKKPRKSGRYIDVMAK
ncbi:Sec23-binding domain of Sec16-domain-containing protein [Dactylonectria macrodidyma]|uniref:Protein transport protein sec16 n=1 Tax=Dactylonectria macrodidyma TaxID=307937 RepID=A0A9P9FMR8_9HYPO|nr:Sec23-binding domain of Sec16-domain-containing protein [Dactylonectria macrodidyma]